MRGVEGGDGVDDALLALLRGLDAAGYDFVMPTLATHGLVARRSPRARPGDLRDIFGWTRSFVLDDLPAPFRTAVLDAEVLLPAETGRHRLSVRVSRIDGRLVLHSAASADSGAVFLGPDSYRFVRLIDEVLAAAGPVTRALDIGVGAGAGALAIAARRPAARVAGTDLNAAALRYTAVNARHAGLDVMPIHGAGLASLGGLFDLIVANPPYIAGRGGRLYRDGGDLFGAELALDWVRSALPRLTAGGRLVLYTGAPVTEGRDLVRAGLENILGDGFTLDYSERDPDVFGGLLQGEAYREIERIAVIGAVVRRRC